MTIFTPTILLLGNGTNCQLSAYWFHPGSAVVNGVITAVGGYDYSNNVQHTTITCTNLKVYHKPKVRIKREFIQRLWRIMMVRLCRDLLSLFEDYLLTHLHLPTVTPHSTNATDNKKERK